MAVHVGGCKSDELSSSVEALCKVAIREAAPASGFPRGKCMSFSRVVCVVISSAAFSLQHLMLPMPLVILVASCSGTEMARFRVTFGVVVGWF